MKPKDLSARISDLESLLNHFSFEELTMEEATFLKSTFNAFKKSLASNSLNPDKDKKEITKQTKREILPALEYLRDSSQLLATGQLTAEQRSYINGMHQISRMLLVKVKGLLPAGGEISPKSSGKTADFNLHHLLRNVLFINKTLTVSPELTISIDIDSGISEVHKGDPSLISQMLMHLFGKGIRFMDRGSISLRISLIGETIDTSFLEFKFLLRDIGTHNQDSELLSQKPELRFNSFRRWTRKYRIKSEFAEVSESEQRIKFVLPFQKSEQRTSIPKLTYNRLDKFPTTIARDTKSQSSNWDTLWTECQGDIRLLEERLNRWQGQLLGFVGRAKVQMRKADFGGLEESSIEIRNNLAGIPFHDIPSLLERIEQTCANERDLGHIRFLYNCLLEEYGNMDRAIASELKRMQKKGGL